MPVVSTYIKVSASATGALSNTTQTDMLPFGAKVLEGSVFHWNDTKMLLVEGSRGGSYETPCILADIKGYVVPVWVRLPQSDFDNLRMTRLQTPGIKAYSCTLGIQGKEKYAPRIYAGAKDW